MYDFGDTVPLRLEVYNTAGALTNATTNTLTIQLPDGTTVTPSTTNTGTGIYECLYVTTQAGLHQWYWGSTVPATGETGSFDVSAQFPGLIVSLAEAKAFLNIDDTDQDDELRAMLEGVTAVVEGGDGKDFPGVGPVVRRTVTTRVDSWGGSGWVLPYTQVLSLTSGAYISDASVVSVAGYTAVDGILRPPVGGALPSSPWTLTYVVGRPTLPANIRLGALEILKQAWASQRGSDAPAFLIPYRALSWLGSETSALGFA